MSDDVRADARQLLSGITPGEWVAEPWEGTTREAVGVFAGSVWGPRVAGLIESEADAEFIAAAPALVQGLLAELDRVEQQVREMATELKDPPGHGWPVKVDAHMIAARLTRILDAGGVV